MTHTIADWLSLHELDVRQCQGISKQIRQLDPGFCSPSSQSTADSGISDIPIEHAWDLVCEAYGEHYQHQDAVLGKIASEVPVNLCSESNASNFVTDRHGVAYPEITLAYRGSAVDILALAHEFAHAAQCVISQGRFVAPAFRELCAFKGELILLEHLRNIDVPLFRDVAWHWQNYNNRYFGTYLTAFDAALSDIDAPYRYEWNYPVARFHSITTHQNYQSAKFWADFSGRDTFGPECASTFDCTSRYSSVIELIIRN